MATSEERFTKLRTKTGVSQQATGDALNASRWAVHNYEAGGNRPDPDGLIVLADYFDVSLNYLVGCSDRRECNLQGETLRPPAIRSRPGPVGITIGQT